MNEETQSKRTCSMFGTTRFRALERLKFYSQSNCDQKVTSPSSEEAYLSLVLILTPQTMGCKGAPLYNNTHTNNVFPNKKQQRFHLYRPTGL